MSIRETVWPLNSILSDREIDKEVAIGLRGHNLPDGARTAAVDTHVNEPKCDLSQP